MYTWGPCDKCVYIKHLKLPGRGHSPSKADVSDIWNFVKQWDVNGKIGEEAPESSSSEVANAQGKSIAVFNSLGNVLARLVVSEASKRSIPEPRECIS